MLNDNALLSLWRKATKSTSIVDSAELSNLLLHYDMASSLWVRTYLEADLDLSRSPPYLASK